MTMVLSPYRSAAIRPLEAKEPERIEHKAWWSDGPLYYGWVPFQTYRWAGHGCWTVRTSPWILVELRP